MEDEKSLTVSSEKLDNALVVRAVGEVDGDTVALLNAALVDATDTVTTPEFVVADLADVTFFGSMGLSALVTAHQRCQDRRTSLVVVASHRRVLQPLHLTDLDHMLTVVDSLTEATTVA